MLNNQRLKVFINAYLTRLEKGETLESIDKSYINIGRLSDEDIKIIHEKINSE